MSNTTIEEIRKSFNKEKDLFPEYLAEDILKLFSKGQLTNKEIENLKNSYLSALKKWNCVNILESKMNYAIKLMNSRASLEYEEIHLLFSLFDSIYSMIYLGLFSNDELKINYEKMQIKFLNERERKKVKLVAQDRFENWKKDRIWYNGG